MIAIEATKRRTDTTRCDQTELKYVNDLILSTYSFV